MDMHEEEEGEEKRGAISRRCNLDLRAYEKGE